MECQPYCNRKKTGVCCCELLRTRAKTLGERLGEILEREHQQSLVIDLRRAALSFCIYSGSSVSKEKFEKFACNSQEKEFTLIFLLKIIAEIYICESENYLYLEH